MKKKRIFYIGFYNGDKSTNRKSYFNLAGSMKMDFIIKVLTNIGYHVNVISIATPINSGFFKMEHNHFSEDLDFYYLPILHIKICKKSVFIDSLSRMSLLIWGFIKLRADDTVIIYHSLALYPTISTLKKIKKFKLVIQVEEIYSLDGRSGDIEANLKHEESSIKIADGYIFVNDVLPQKYALNKPYAVSYGNYTIFNEKHVAYNYRDIGIVYTGIINDERGAFITIEAMSFLPKNYSLHILGFGQEKNLIRMHELINKVNLNAGFEKVKFYGTKTGKEYTNFLNNFQIGVSIMDVSSDISMSAFPSKILAYLGHSLIVVSSKNKCITESKISDLLYFCDDNPKSIADTILHIDITKLNQASEKLRILEKEFQDNLKMLL